MFPTQVRTTSSHSDTHQHLSFSGAAEHLRRVCAAFSLGSLMTSLPFPFGLTKSACQRNRGSNVPLSLARE